MRILYLLRRMKQKIRKLFLDLFYTDLAHQYVLSSHNKDRLCCYLAGPMETAKDSGINWRLHYQKELNNLGIDCIIPELYEQEITSQNELTSLKYWNINKYKKIMHKLIYLDLNVVRAVDFIVIKWEGERTAGTIGEAQEAFLNNKPVYLVSSMEDVDILGWFLSCCTEHFKTDEQFFEFMKNRRPNE